MSIEHLAIDPGKTGAAAFHADGTLHVFRITNDTPRLAAQLRGLKAISDSHTQAYMEDVGYGRPKTNVKAVTTFARHCGMLEGMLETLEFDYTLVTPQKWMRKVYPDRPTGVAASATRKLYILDESLEWAESYFNDIVGTIDINSADAVGILRYGIG